MNVWGCSLNKPPHVRSVRVGLASSCGGEDRGWDEGHSGSKVLWDGIGRRKAGSTERREIEREESIREGRREGGENIRRVSRKKNGEHEVRASCERGGAGEAGCIGGEGEEGDGGDKLQSMAYVARV